MFTQSFTTYAGLGAYAGQNISCEVDGFTVTARLERDDDAGAPWEREDGHGAVSEWTRRAKAPGERVLNEDGRSRRYYDFAGAVETAKRDGWGGDGATPGERAADAAEKDFARLRAWCDDEWEYVGVVLTVEREGVRLTDDYGAALWGIESDAGDYLREVANQLLGDALDAARAKLAQLCNGACA